MKDTQDPTDAVAVDAIRRELLDSLDEELEMAFEEARLEHSTPVSAAGRGYCQLGAEEAKLPRAQPSREYTSAYECNTGRIAPGEEGAIASSSVLTGRETMTAELEVIVDRSVNREKLLRLLG
jgi:hypothetical protein